MKKLLLISSALLAFGCATEPSIQQGPDAEVTFDGLVRIDNSAFQYAWIDPEVDLKSYNKIMAGKAEFEFRAVKKSAQRTTMRTTNQSEFWISEENREKLIETVTGIFSEELSRSKNFAVTNERGADTLILVGGLSDIVSNVPPDFTGPGEIYLSSVGEATLVLELRDSLSGETIYRAVDRRKMERPGNDVINANVVTSWAEVRRTARRWATRLVAGLDSIHD